MKKLLLRSSVVGVTLLTPFFAFAAIEVTGVSFEDGGPTISTINVDPGESFEVYVHATLTEFSKWKGTQWGIHKGNPVTPYCFNNKNDKDRNDNNPNDGPYTQPIVVTAPAEEGLYHLSVVGSDRNQCDNPLGGKTKPYSVRVGEDNGAPIISGHSDVVVEIESGGPSTYAIVDYDLPTATDNYDPFVEVICAPASGSFFPLGDTVVTCTATDSAGNEAIPVEFTVSVLSLDTVPPVIDPHDDVEAETGDGAGAIVNYDVPTATDDTDGPVAVDCVPASGSLFVLGDTVVTCTAEDTAGNSAQSSFVVKVIFVSVPFTMASQPDDSFLCAPSWRTCYTGGTTQHVVDLGQGSSLGGGTILSVTIARDESHGPILEDFPWNISIRCYTDASHTTFCPDWVTPNGWNANQKHLITEPATSTPDLKYWTAYFTNPTKESNFDGSHPVEFDPDYFYTLSISDVGVNIGAYGSPTEPYWVLTGMTLP